MADMDKISINIARYILSFKRNKFTINHRKFLPIACVFIGLSFLVAPYGGMAESNLGSIGNTPLQQITGDSVTETCKGFVQSGTARGTVPLFDTCRAMVQTGNAINNLPGTEDSLGLNRDELAASLQQIATEEFTNTESMSTELSNNRLNAALTRLTDIRNGVKGLTINSLNSGTVDGIASGTEMHWDKTPMRGAAAGDDASWGNFSMFVSGNLGTGDRDETVWSDQYDFDTYSLNVGADYRFTDHLVLGTVITYYKIDSEFDVTSTVNGGSVDSDGFGGAIYGTYFGKQYYVDVLAGFSQPEYDIKRNILIPSRNQSISTINETANSTTNSDDFTLSLGGGYQFQQGGITYGPFARMTYLSVDVDGYQESGAEASGLNLTVDSQKWKSLTSVFGLNISYASNQNFGVLLPQAQIGWVHEFENDSQEYTAFYTADPRKNQLIAVTDNPDRDYFELGVGLSAVLQNGLQAFVNYETLLGLSYLDTHLFSFGVRWEF